MKTVLKMLAICMMAGGLGVQSVYAEPLVIQEQGSFSAGGTIITAPGTFDAKKPLDSAGQTYHGDHASVFYQIPENPHKYPIVMLHGAGQSSRTWESTPDGREGFQNIFLRRGFSTYIVDQPRRGDAGRTTVEGTVTPKPDEQMWFNQFRVGVWPDYFKGVQFSHDKEALNQYFRQMTPNTGPFDVNVISDAMSAVVDKSGPAILFTHSQGGGPGWYTAMKNNKVKAIVAFEPGSGFVFPEKELPAPMPSAFDTLKGEPVPMEQFMALTKIPILIIYGDNIPDKPVAMPAQDSWRVRLAMARKWRDVVNKHGGDVTVTHLPEVGIKGNTHFPFTDLNNVQIADLVSRFLKEKNLQKNENTLQLAIISRIKMFYRPTHLAMAPEEAPAMLRFRRSGSKLTLINPTPYFITVTNMKAGNSNLPNTMVPPKGEVSVDIPHAVTGDISFQTINDYGALTPRIKATMQ